MVVTETMAIFKKVVAITTVLGIAVPSAVSAEMVYHRGNGGDPETLDPHKTTLNIEHYILSDLLEGLVTYDASGAAYPGVAKSWNISEDGTVYTFHFRDDAKWSNGAPVTAGDFVFSLRRLMTPSTGAKYATLLYPIKNAKAINTGKLDPSELGVKAVDDKTLIITLEAPTPYFIEELNSRPALPVYPPAVEHYGDNFVKPGNMVSNGAYMLQSAVPNAQVVVVKNPYFHDAENVAIDKVIFIPTEDRASALRRFIAGELDSNYQAPLHQAKWMRENLGRRFHVFPSLGTYFYALNTEKPPFDDIRVRRALSMAIDRRFLAEKIWNDVMLPGLSFVPPGIPNYGEPVMPDYANDSMLDREDEAIALMKQAGCGPDHPLKLELRYNTGENHKNTALAVADMWKPLGVEATLVNADIAAHYALLKNGGDFDVARVGSVADYPDAQNFLFLAQSDNPGYNFAHYRNPKFDELMARAADTVDLKERRDILRRAQTILEKDAANIPLLYYTSFNLVSDGLKGWKDNGLDMHLSRWMRVEP